MTQNERLAVVENEVRHISTKIGEVLDILKKHIDREESYLSKVEAVKLFATKNTEIEFRKAKNSINWLTRLLIITLVGILTFMFQQWYVYTGEKDEIQKLEKQIKEKDNLLKQK